MTDCDLHSCGRLMASIPLRKNLIFMKYLGFSSGTSLFTGLNSL